MNRKALLLTTTYIFALLWMFGGGWFAHTLLNTPTAPLDPTPTVTPFPTSIATTPELSPTPIVEPFTRTGFTSYDVLIATTSLPQRMVYLDIVYYDQSAPYLYAHYFDGVDWNTTKLEDSDVTITETVARNNFVHSIEGNFEIDETKISIAIPRLYTPMVVRARRDHAKYAGTTTTPAVYIAINGVPTTSHAAMIKGYKDTLDDVGIIDLGLNTFWVMYWDSDWNFYHLDTTKVEIDYPEYPPHAFFGRIVTSSPTSAYGSVEYFSDIVPTQSSTTLEVNYSPNQQLRLPIGATFKRPKTYEQVTNYRVGGEDNGTGVLIKITSKAKS